MTLAFMNIGTQEMIFIVIIILLLFGGKKLPELARGLGKGIREFKDASDGIKREISDQINNFEKDLDVTVEDKPTTSSSNTDTSEEKKDEEFVNNEDGEDKKGFPGFTSPENTYQHNPGEQPSSGGDHYSYGYNDHFAESTTDASEEKEQAVTPETGTQDDTKNA